MGLQLAYHYAGRLGAALDLLMDKSNFNDDGTLTRTFLDDLTADATADALPSPVACKDKWCGHKFTCATANEPRHDETAGLESLHEKENGNTWSVQLAYGMPE